MIRSVVALSVLVLAAFAAKPAQAETAVPCESATNGGDYFEITCPVSSVGAAELRFRAHFTGVHDDSAATMTVRLDGKEVACGPGSTPRLLGEGDEGTPGGDGFIECRLVTEGRANVEQQLFVILTWKHAQHTGHELVAVSKH